MRTIELLRPLMLASLAILVLAMLPSFALAEEHGGGGGLEFTGFKRYDLGIYTLIVFSLLIFILSKYAWPHIKEGLEKREASIKTAHEEAKQDRISAEARLAEAKKQLDEAGAKASAILDEARKVAEQLKISEREAGVKAAEGLKQQAEREIASLRESNLKDLYEKAVQLAALISEKALRREVSAADHSRLLNESLAELRAANKA